MKELQGHPPAQEELMRSACNSKMPEWESWNSCFWPPPSSDVQQIARIKNSRIQLKSSFFTREQFLWVTTAPNIYLKLNRGNIANMYFEKAGSVLVTDVVASEGLVLQRQWNVANCLLVLLSPGGRNRLFLRNSHPLTPLQHYFGRKYRSCW